MSAPERTWDRAPQVSTGNGLALRHGAYSPRVVDPIAEQLVDAMLAEPDTAYLSAPSYRPALWAWAQKEARVQVLTEHAARLGVDGLGEDGRADATYTHLDKAERAAERARQQLGLDPLSRARLGRDKAAASVDWAQVLSGLGEGGALPPVGHPAPVAIDAPAPAHGPSATDARADR